MSNPNSALKDIRYLFRFRDLIANTLSEHERIIREHGACWWGWWKRPTESNRDDVWNPLSSQAQPMNPVKIGLFDSGSGHIYTALVSNVIKPANNVGELLPVPQGEETLVPEYYRRSPFSRAWMKLTKIDETPIDFFGNYSFAKIPRLPNYSEHVLRRLEDKIIKTPDELRGMDTTIWEVRLQRPSDHDEVILLTTRSMAVPVSKQTIDLPSSTILHITDPHFALGKHRGQHIWRLESEMAGNRDTLAEAVKGAVNKSSIGLVVLSGDLTFTGADTEFEEASRSITRLLGFWSLDKDHLVVMPGNHDIQWTKKDKYKDNAPVTEAPDQARKNYEDFYKGFFGHRPNGTLSMGRRYALPSGIILEVCALNSSSLETGPKFLAGMGRVEESAFTKVANELGWDEPNMSLRILALHHHLTLTEDLEPAGEYSKGYGLAVDATRILRYAARHGVHIALHGHKHRAFIWRSSVYELPEHTQSRWHLGNINIVGGGSAGSTATQSTMNYFNLIHVTTQGVEVEMYRASNAGSFQPMIRWRAEFELDKESGLMLSDWQRESDE